MNSNCLCSRPVLLAGLIVLVCSVSVAASAQLNQSSSVAVSATLSETLTMSIGTPTLAIPLLSNTMNVSPQPIIITTAWAFSNARTNLTLVSFFSNTATALSDGGTPEHDIGTSNIYGQDTGTGTSPSNTPYTNYRGNPVGSPNNAGLTLYSLPMTPNSTTNRSGNRVDNLLLKIDLTGQILPAATYSGILTFQAQAI